MRNRAQSENLSVITIPLNFTAEHAENERGIRKPREDWNGLKTLCPLR
jgi:hypothetical protein